MYFCLRQCEVPVMWVLQVYFSNQQMVGWQLNLRALYTSTVMLWVLRQLWGDFVSCYRIHLFPFINTDLLLIVKKAHALIELPIYPHCFSFHRSSHLQEVVIDRICEYLSGCVVNSKNQVEWLWKKETEDKEELLQTILWDERTKKERMKRVQLPWSMKRVCSLRAYINVY